MVYTRQTRHSRRIMTSTVLNPELVIANLTSLASLSMSLRVERGRGYRPPLDARFEEQTRRSPFAARCVFSPIRRGYVLGHAAA